MSTKQSQGKTHRYLQLCKAYRNHKGQPYTRNLANFGSLEKLDRKKVDTAINGLIHYGSNPRLSRLSDFVSLLYCLLPIGIDRRKILENTRSLVKFFDAQGISVIGMTKVMPGGRAVANAMLAAGVGHIGDSRIENIVL